MKRFALLVPLAAGLATHLSAQELAAPTPELDSGIVAQGEEDNKRDGVWHSSVNLGTSWATGNIDRRAASLNAEASREDNAGRTMVRATWNYSEQKRLNPNTGAINWGLDQRRTTGEARQDWWLTDDERTYAFVHVEAQNDFNQRIDLRLAATLGVGRKLIAEENLTWSLEVGVGYYTERSRNVGVADTENPVGRAGSELDWKFAPDWQLLHSARVYVSLEDADDAYGISDARLRTKLGDATFGQLQWILQWDNTPNINAFGSRERVDHLVLITVGWTF